MKRMAVFLILGLVLAGCASVPKKPMESKGVVFEGSIEDVQEAAVDALVIFGFDIKKQNKGYVEGFRPRKLGLLTGSGGETVGIWLESLSMDRTRVLVQTAKSLLGIAVQKRWDQKIIDEMKEKLEN